MKEYFVERENLAKMADSLIAQKYPGQPKEELGDLREKTIDQLDETISNTIIGSLNKEQFEELEAMLAKPETSTDDLKGLFEKNGINLDEKVTNAMKEFSQKFLGGDK